MLRLFISTVSVILSAQALAGGTPINHTPQQPVQQGPTSLAPPSPQLTSANFVPGEVVPGQAVSIQLGGINLLGKPGTAPTPYSGCIAKVTWPSGFATLGTEPAVAYGGTWSRISGFNAPSFPGTYVVAFQAMDAWDPFAGVTFKCMSNGPVYATLIVKPGLVAPKGVPSVSQ